MFYCQEDVSVSCACLQLAFSVTSGLNQVQMLCVLCLPVNMPLCVCVSVCSMCVPVYVGLNVVCVCMSMYVCEYVSMCVQTHPWLFAERRRRVHKQSQASLELII